jgi:hypothetical protein
MNFKKFNSRSALPNDTLKSRLEAKLNDIEFLVQKLNAKRDKFPFTHASHFTNIISDIDIRRETLILNFRRQNVDKNFNESSLEEIYAQSSDMIRKVEIAEKNYWTNFTRIASKLIEFNIEKERKDLEEYNLKHLEDIGYELERNYDRKIRDLQKNLENFKLFQYDLNQNRFSFLNSFPLGKLYLSTKFVETLDQKIQNIIVAHWNKNELEIWNLNTTSLVKRLNNASNRAKCLILGKLIAFKMYKLF